MATQKGDGISKNVDGTPKGSIWTFCSCAGVGKIVRTSRACDEWRMSMHLDGTTTCREGNAKGGEND